MDRYRYPELDNAAGHGRHRHRSISYDAPDHARQLGARDDLLRLRHYPPGTPRQRPQRQARAGVEEGCRVQAFEGEDAAPRAPHCARIITGCQKAEAAAPTAHETRAQGLTVR